MAVGSWKDLVEILGIIAVVASLLFVGIQLRQDQAIAEAQVYADFDDTQIALSELIIENRDVWMAGSKGEELSESDQLIFEALALAVISKYNGFMSRATRLDTRPVADYAVQWAYLLYSYPGLRRSFERRCRISRELFRSRSGPCQLVLPVLEEFDTGLRTMPTEKYFAQ